VTDSTRRVSGARLGQVIAKDLKKKEKSTIVNRDPHLDLNIDGRELGVEGLRILCGIGCCEGMLM
jgi:hypothetical protein